MLFGGVGKTTHEMTKLRGDVNICIVGEYFTTFESYLVQVNLCQKLLFLHQLTQNMPTDCSLNCKFSTWKLHINK